MDRKAIKPDSVARIRDGEVLDLDTLRPGDIILSRPDTWESFWLAFFGRSRFSHACLVVSDEVLGEAEAAQWRSSPGQPYTLVIEATTATPPNSKEIVGGVGYWRLSRNLIRVRDSSALPKGRVSPLKPYAYFEVFRHSDCEKPEFQTFFRQGIATSCNRYVNEPYARLSALAKVSIAPWFVKLVGEWFIDLPKSRREGLFCSQLVASIFRDGGFPLSKKDPSLIRPRDIAKAACLMRTTPTPRRRLEPNEELVRLQQAIDAIDPDILSGVAGKFEPGVLEQVFPADDMDEDFRGRVTAWQLRDQMEIATQQAENRR